MIEQPCVVTRTTLPNDVYIGRKFRSFKGGYWGNPFGGEGSIPLFETMFQTRLRHDEVFALRALALRGLRLACFCKPNPCHGDVIADWVNGHKLEDCLVAVRELERLNIPRMDASGESCRAWWKANGERIMNLEEPLS